MSSSDSPRALVVYESMFGNSQKVASAIGDGLRQTIPTELVRVGDAPSAIPDDVRLLVVGGPTHELGMSCPSTRAQAAAQGELVMPAELGIREWIGQLHAVRRIPPPSPSTPGC